jgi:hypothetical protein
MVRGDEFVQVKKYGGFSVKMPARSLFRDGGSTYFGGAGTTPVLNSPVASFGNAVRPAGTYSIAFLLSHSMD